MKKITSFLLLVMVCLTVVQPTFANDGKGNLELEGATYKKVNNIIDVDKKVSNIKLDIKKNSVKGHFTIDNEKVKIDAEFIEKDKNNFDLYIGTAEFKNATYNVDIIENDKGLSGLIYDDRRTDVIPFLITKNLSSDKTKVKPKDILSIMNSEITKQSNVFEPMDIDIGINSIGINRSKYIEHKGVYGWEIVSSGEVYGTLYYKTDIGTGKFWVDKVVGTIS